jgi:hypothetical protein
MILMGFGLPSYSDALYYVGPGHDETLQETVILSPPGNRIHTFRFSHTAIEIAQALVKNPRRYYVCDRLLAEASNISYLPDQRVTDREGVISVSEFVKGRMSVLFTGRILVERR